MLINATRLAKKCSLAILVASCFVGVFFVGRFSRSYMSKPTITDVFQQSLRLAEGGSQEGRYNDQRERDALNNNEQQFEIVKELKPVPWDYDQQFKNPCFRNDSSSLYCIPLFYIVGGIESGTKLLYRAIMQHPEAVYPGFEEANFFSTKDLADLENGGVHDYIRMYANASRMILGDANIDDGPDNYNNLITGDATPYMNLWWNTSYKVKTSLKPEFSILEYIYHLVPHARIIVIFRDPVERLYAHYCNCKKPVEDPTWLNPTHFHDRACRAIATYNQLFRRTPVRDRLYYEGKQNFNEFSLMFGMHYFYWNELTSVFPRRQILALHYRQLFTKETLHRVFSFLGMANPGPNVWYRIRLLQAAEERSGPCGDKKMYWRTRMVLREFYAPYNELMYDLIKDKEFLYPLNK